MTASRPRGDRPHVVVVGTGPCGAMAIDRLRRHDVTVTLLDSGVARPRGLIVRAAGNTLARYTSSGAIQEGGHQSTGALNTTWFHSLSLGGLSNYWTGAVPRFSPSDFDEGARRHERYRWPVTYADLEPFYDVVESKMLVTASGRSARHMPASASTFQAPMPADWIAAAAVLDGHDLSMVPIPMAKGAPWMAGLRSTEFNSFTALVRPHLDSEHLELRTGAHVDRLSWSPTTGRVDAVEYTDVERGEQQRLAVDAVVLAAGAVNSTRILERSRSSDFPAGLGNTHDVLGRYLHDHPKQWWPFQLTHPMTLPHHPIYITRRDYDATPPLLAASFTIGLASPRDRLRTFVRGSGTGLAVQVFGTMIPTGDHRITASTSITDDFGHPIPEIAISYDDDARSNMASAAKRMERTFSLLDNPITMPDELPELQPGSSVHYGGSVRMHDRPEYGMLDGWNRIHDVQNVAVVDKSCFTTGPEKNPTLTAMALAARAADRLAEELTGARR